MPPVSFQQFRILVDVADDFQAVHSSLLAQSVPRVSASPENVSVIGHDEDEFAISILHFGRLCGSVAIVEGETLRFVFFLRRPAVSCSVCPVS
jgi:hypothetical protein